MYNDERPERTFYAVNFEDDDPVVSFGSLIPSKEEAQSSLPEDKGNSPSRFALLLSGLRPHVTPIVFITLPIFALVVMAGLGGYTFVTAESAVATPMVVIGNSASPNEVPLSYGVKMELSQPDFFAETHTAFIDNNLTFIEADLTSMQITYYQDGQEIFTAPILAKGKEGSWWETPAGLYEISYKKENHFSSFGQVYQPYSMAFQGNFFIHGWPRYPNGTPVETSFSGGCIRLDTNDAASLFELVDEGTPILVHEEAFAGDDFLYEAKIPEISAPHYLVADVKSNTVLASSDLDVVAPIASLTKLMTALIAAEYINLDSTVWKNQEAFVPSLVPRLEGRVSVSMYSLLQLLLVESSNEAAEIIAAQLGRERFIALMNEKADSLGLLDTTFADPSGFSGGNKSSLRDLLRLTQYIYHNRSFIIELTANQDLPTAYTSGEFGTLNNFNEFKELDNFIGGKVGETSAAGQTSISLHEVKVREEVRVVALIVLGSEGRTDDVLKLLDFVERRFGD